jgi:hypothetical protein
MGVTLVVRVFCLLVLAININHADAMDPCINDCSTSVQVAYNNSDQSALCELNDFDCLDDCGGNFNNAYVINSHCECTINDIFTHFSYSFAGIPYCCNGYDCRFVAYRANIDVHNCLCMLPNLLFFCHELIDNAINPSIFVFIHLLPYFPIPEKQ